MLGHHPGKMMVGAHFGHAQTGNAEGTDGKGALIHFKGLEEPGILYSGRHGFLRGLRKGRGNEEQGNQKNHYANKIHK
jgi:hypothetical protein